MIIKNKDTFLNIVDSIDIDTFGGYTFNQIMNNKNCSKNTKYWKVIEKSLEEEEPRFLFNSGIAKSWEYIYPKIKNPLRNTNQIYLYFTNSIEFSSESNKFKDNDFYVEGIEGIMKYEKYWDEQEDIIINGTIIDGVRITGRHYFAVNFGRIQAIPTDSKGNAISKRKIDTFLRFLDHQYYFLNEVEEALLEGVYNNEKEFLKWFPLKTEIDYKKLKRQNMLVVKSRRKGFSYIIDNALYAYYFSFTPYSQLKLFAQETQNYETTLKGLHNTLNFLNDNTPFGKRRAVLKRRDHFRASFKEIIDGVEIERGYMSEFQALSFKDNSYKGIGSSADFIGVEEGGAFDNLLETYGVSIEPVIRDGEQFIGNCFIWGSTTDMSGNGAISLRDMMYKPEAYNMKCFHNIYEEQVRTENVGWFVDDLWYAPNIIDKNDLLPLIKDDEYREFVKNNYGDLIEVNDINGNSHRDIAKWILLQKRKVSKQGSQRSYQKLITQQPIYLTDAFLINESSPFDIALAQASLAKLLTSDDKNFLQGTFTLSKDNEPLFIPDPSAIPILEYPNKMPNTDGCWVIYERPIQNAPDWRYISGADPIDFGYEESSSSGQHSLAATYIIDTITRNIVAEYLGRPRTAELYYEQALRGVEWYNAQLLYENNLKGLFSYFLGRNKLYLLADEPMSLKDRFGYKNNNRVKGFHATQQINSLAREFINKWATEQVTIDMDKEGNKVDIARMYLIKSKGLLQEIINWNSKGNFDRISGLGAAMLLLFEREKYIEDINEKVEDFFSSTVFEKIRSKKGF